LRTSEWIKLFDADETPIRRDAALNMAERLEKEEG
jgi:hypothetical protein